MGPAVPMASVRAPVVTRRRLWGLALVAALLVPVLAGSAGAAVGDYRCSDPSLVYLGNARLIREPCVLSADRVYRQIPEYRQILERGLDDEDVEYHFLMKKASERFAKAVKQMARSLGHDFVAEIGAIDVVNGDAGSPPDRTDEVISRLA